MLVKSIRWLSAIFISAVVIGPASAQEYPDKPITLITTFAAGGATDTTMRYIAEYAGKKLGQNVVVDNRPGAGGAVGLNAIAQAEPDGYVLGLGASSPLTVLPHSQETPYDTKKSFAYIAQYATVPAPIAVRADSPFNNFADIVKYAKENPRQFRWSGAAPKGVRHIVVETAFRKAGVETTYVPYQGGSQTLLALQGGEIDAMVVAEFANAYRAGTVKLIARTDRTSIAGAEDLPTLVDLGYPLSPEVFYGLIGPADLPPAVVDKWETLVKEAIESPGFVELAQRLGLVPSFVGSAKFKELVLNDFDGIGAAVKALDLE